jgi:hypothetical protein
VPTPPATPAYPSNNGAAPATPGTGGAISPIPAPNALNNGNHAADRPLFPSTSVPGNSAGPEPSSSRVDPENRTTARPVYQTGYYQLIASPPETTPVQTVGLDDSGWQASHD